MKKPKLLWILIVFFTWLFLKSAGAVGSAQNDTDYILLASLGIGWGFYLLNILLMVAEAMTAYLLFKQKAQSLVVAKWLMVAECVYRTVISILSLKADDFYKVGREISEGFASQWTSFHFTIQGDMVAPLFYLVFYALLYYYLRTGKLKLTK